MAYSNGFDPNRPILPSGAAYPRGFVSGDALAETAGLSAGYGPAGMTQLPGLRLSAGVVGIKPSFKFSDEGSSGLLGTGGNGGNAGNDPTLGSRLICRGARRDLRRVRRHSRRKGATRPSVHAPPATTAATMRNRRPQEKPPPSCMVASRKASAW